MRVHIRLVKPLEDLYADMFQTTVYFDENDTPPSFLDKEAIKGYTLIQATKKLYRNGMERVPTPEKTAILELSKSFEKKRLGKQQQILCDMAQRCREQEISDLSRGMTSQCSTISRNSNECVKYSTNYVPKRKTFMSRVSDSSLLSSYGGFAIPTVPENADTFFPQRRIIRKYKGFNEFGSNSKVSKMTLGYFEDEHSREVNEIEFNEEIPKDSHQQEQKAKHHFAPLLLPDIRIKRKQTNELDSYFSTSKLKMTHRKDFNT